MSPLCANCASVTAGGMSNMCRGKIASFVGIKAREIATYRKCELCEVLFDSPEVLRALQDVAGTALPKWVR